MKVIFKIIAVFFVLNTTAQNHTNCYLKTGLNRIGVLYEAGANYNFEAHNIALGIRFYEPDLVFEKDFPGLNLAYLYSFRNEKKMHVNLGIEMNLFHEKKQTTKLKLFDPKLVFGPEWVLNNRINLNLMAAIGTVINRAKTINNTINTYTYLNYELALAITYRFGNNPTN